MKGLSVKYVEYVRAINNLYNLGYINEMQIPEADFMKLSEAEQNRHISSVNRFHPEEDYILINRDKGIKAHKSVVKSFQMKKEKLINKFPSLGKTAVNGKPVIDLISMFNLQNLKPTDNTEWVNSTPDYAVKLLRDGLISNLEKVKAEPVYIQSTIPPAIMNDVSNAIARVQNEYTRLIVFVGSMTSEELLNMIAKTRGLELALDPIIVYFDRTLSDEQKKQVLNDKVQERIDYLDSIQSHRWV